MEMALKLVKIAGIAALLAGSTLAQGQVREANHTLGSALDVWRVELRNPERFLAMSAGDTDGVSELHKVEVKLIGTDAQVHSITESNPFFRINDGPRKVDNWIGVRRGDRVRLDRVDAENPDTYNLWVHAKERKDTEFGSSLQFQIKVSARELDCAANNICGRSDTGVITYFVSMPIPSNRSLNCIPENRFRIAAVNGGTLTLRPLVNGVDPNFAAARQEYSGGSTGIDIASGEAKGPHLALQSGEICIAATKLMPKLPDVRPDAPNIPRDRKLPQAR